MYRTETCDQKKQINDKTPLKEAEIKSVRLQVKQKTATQYSQKLQEPPLLDHKPDNPQEDHSTQEINQHPYPEDQEMTEQLMPPEISEPDETSLEYLEPK